MFSGAITGVENRSKLFGSSLDLTLIKTSALFWAGYDARKQTLSKYNYFVPFFIPCSFAKFETENICEGTIEHMVMYQRNFRTRFVFGLLTNSNQFWAGRGSVFLHFLIRARTSRPICNSVAGSQCSV